MRKTLTLFAFAAATVGGCAVSQAAEPEAAVSEARLRADIEALVGFGTRHTLSAQDDPARGIGAARRWAEAQFREASKACGDCLEIALPETMVSGDRIPEPARIVDVIAIQRGTERPDEVVIVQGHIDSRVSDVMDANSDAPGANDNASGVASMLELAARLKAAPPRHSVLFVALDGEERGLIGADQFIQRPPVPLESIALNVNLDMTARVDDGYLWATGTWQYPQLRPMLDPIQPVGSVRLVMGKDTPSDTGADNWVNSSDHAVFHRERIPFVYFGVDYHPDYHEPTDDYERVVPARFIAATELIVQGFRALDEGLAR